MRTHTALFTGVSLWLAAFTINIHAAPAFPEARGHGANTTGGRSSSAKVFIVDRTDDPTYSSTNNNGMSYSSCSLRFALSPPDKISPTIGATPVVVGTSTSLPRIVVFKTGGYFDLTSRILILKGDLTVAGQTAPGGGVHIRRVDDPPSVGDRSPIYLRANNVIMRYITCRKSAGSSPGTNGGDAFTINGGNNIILDHCSVNFGWDGTLDVFSDNSTTGVSNLTVQYSLVAGGLADPADGSHSTGSLTSRSVDPNSAQVTSNYSNISYYRNILAHAHHRLPKLSTNNRNASDPAGLQLVNNVIYGWATKGLELQGEMVLDIDRNYFRPSPWTDNHADGSPLVRSEDMAITWTDGVNDDPSDPGGELANLASLSLFVSGNAAQFCYSNGGSLTSPATLISYATIREADNVNKGAILSGYAVRTTKQSINPAISGATTAANLVNPASSACLLMPREREPMPTTTSWATVGGLQSMDCGKRAI